MLFSVETKKKKLFQNTQNFPSLNIMSEYMLRVHIKANVVMWNNKP